jgi:sulfite exporter TauE/SafE
MIAFGLGTLPSMVTATVAFDRIARGLSQRASLRRIAGALLLAFGLWTAGYALYHAFGHGGHAGHTPAQSQPAAPGGEAMPPGHEHHH